MSTTDLPRFEAAVIVSTKGEEAVILERVPSKIRGRCKVTTVLRFEGVPDVTDERCPVYKKMKVVEYALNEADRSCSL